MADTPQLCATCAVFNVFNSYFGDYAKDAYVVIGNSVTVLVFGFALAIGLMRYAMFRLAPHMGKDSPPAIDLVQLLTFLGVVGALRVADAIVWRVYEAFLDWGSGVAILLIEKGSNGSMTVPTTAVTPIAKIVGSAESLLWGFVKFAYQTLSSPNFLDLISQGPGSLAASIAFSFLVLVVYGGLLLYFAYFILQAYIFILLPVPFGSLIVAAAAFKETRQTTWEALRLVVFGFGTFIGSGIAMGFTGRVLELSKNTISCFLDTREASACGNQIRPLAEALGIPAGALTETFTSFEIFTVLIILGACCWIVHYLTLHVVAKLLGTTPMGGPLAIAASATVGTIYLGGRHLVGGTKEALLRSGGLTRGLSQEFGGRGEGGKSRSSDPLRMD